jgi:hypothetical protein
MTRVITFHTWVAATTPSFLWYAKRLQQLKAQDVFLVCVSCLRFLSCLAGLSAHHPELPALLVAIEYLTVRKTASFFECFPYVCPEPVLAK